MVRVVSPAECAKSGTNEKIIQDVLAEFESLSFAALPREVRELIISHRLPYLDARHAVPSVMQPSPEFYSATLTAVADSLSGFREAYEFSPEDGAIVVPGEFRPIPDHHFRALRLSNPFGERAEDFRRESLFPHLHMAEGFSLSEFEQQKEDLFQRMNTVIDELKEHGVTLRHAVIGARTFQTTMSHCHVWAVTETVSENTPGTVIFGSSRFPKTDPMRESVPYVERAGDLGIIWGSRQHGAPDPKDPVEPYDEDTRICWSIVQSANIKPFQILTC